MFNIFERLLHFGHSRAIIITEIGKKGACWTSRFTINTNWQGVLAELVAPPRMGGFVLAERWMDGHVICPGAGEGLLAEQARLALQHCSTRSQTTIPADDRFPPGQLEAALPGAQKPPDHNHPHPYPYSPINSPRRYSITPSNEGGLEGACLFAAIPKKQFILINHVAESWNIGSPKVRCHISIASAMNRSSFTLVTAFVRLLIPIGILQGQ